MGLIYDYDRRTAASLPTAVSAPFRHNADREAVQKLFREYVGDAALKSLEAGGKKIATALKKAVSDLTFTASELRVSVLPSSFGTATVNIEAKSPVRALRFMALELHSHTVKDPAEQYYLTSDSKVFQPPVYRLSMYAPGNANPMLQKAFPAPPTPKVVKDYLDEFTVDRLITLLGGPFKGKTTAKPTLKQVEEFIARQRTYFDLERNPNFLAYSTRENGDVGDGQPGEFDLDEARRLLKAIREEYGLNVVATIDRVDEWVNLDVKIAP